jgi:sugar O-acyltransferase (sialic acid O-acetyltransferase NeuD family)
MNSYRIIGKGGLFSIIKELLIGKANFDGYYDDNHNEGPNYRGTFREIDLNADINYFLAIGGENNMLLREKLMNQIASSGNMLMNCISEKAHLYDNSRIGSGNIVMPFAHIGSQCVIGNGTIVYSGSIIEHDSIVGDNVILTPGVRTGGGCCIGNNVFIGIGSTLSDGVTVGEGSIIGAGSLVLKDIPSGVLVYGSPAKAIGLNTIYRKI